jgi:hypothetical protein
MRSSKNSSSAVAAAKAGFIRATGYRIDVDPRLSSQKDLPRERRRPDPHLPACSIVPMLEAAPGERAVAVFAEALSGPSNM